MTVTIACAAFCSLALTFLTAVPPLIPLDWARLDRYGMSVPQPVVYAWPSPALQVGLWVLMVAALWRGSRTQRGTEAQGEKNRETILRGQFECGLKRNILLGLLTLLGFGLRVYSLTGLPLILDEIGFAAHASDILHGQPVPLLAPGHYGNPSTYSWLVALAMHLFGQNALAIRFAPLVFGTLSIVVVYRLGRAWWSPRVGLLAAAFVAVYPVHVYFSRQSVYNIIDPFFAMLALIFLKRGVWRNRYRDYVLAGALAASAQYFYHGARLLWALMAVYLLLESRKSFRRDPRGAGWLLLTVTLLSLPVTMPRLVHGLPLTGNLKPLQLPDDLAENTLRALLAWAGQPDVSPFWLSRQPLLTWPALVALVIGITASWKHWDEGRGALPMVWILMTTLVGGALLIDAPLYVRYLEALPAVALLVALGLAHWRRAGLVLALLVCLYGAQASLEHPLEARAHISAAQRQVDDLAKQAAKLPEDVAAVLVFPAEPGDLARLTIAHYVAALGRRRALAVNTGQPGLTAFQRARLPGRSVILTP